MRHLIRVPSPGALSILAVAALLHLAGCSAGSEGDATETTEDVREELASQLVERVIPLRVVQLIDVAGAPDFVVYDDVRQRVQEANWTFRAAGVQFYVAKWEKLLTPTFSNIDPDDALHAKQWSNVRAELQLMFPSLPAGAYPDSTLLWESQWIGSAAGKAADRSEIAVIFAKSVPGYYWGDTPRKGGPFVVLAPGIGYKFTHELGHVLGLAHTHESHPTSFNPISAAENPSSDAWDLVYVPPSTTFVSRAAAEAQENNLQTKNVEPQNCSVDSSCTVQCTISGVSHSTGSAMLNVDFA